MDKIIWFSILHPIITIAVAIWTKKIVPSILIGWLVGSYLLHPALTGGFETAVDQIVKTLTDSGSLQVLLFLYLFSGLMSIIKKSGGIKAFSDIAYKHVKSEKGVFFLLWALIPVTFIDCGFRIVGAGSITSSLAEKNKIAKERFAFMLNNTASPVVELIPIATTFVGFNIANISIGLKAAGNPESASAHSILLKAIPLEFFSIVLIIVTFLTIFFQFKKQVYAPAKPSVEKEMKGMTSDVISGGNEIMTTLVILTIAWPLASVSQELGLNEFIHQNLGSSMPTWSVAVSLFILSSAVTYFIGSGWWAASLLMPIVISLAVVSSASIPLCVAAIITGGTFGDVTSPVAGMTNMSPNIAHADHAKYLKYASPYSFIAAGIAAILFLIVGFFHIE